MIRFIVQDEWGVVLTQMLDCEELRSIESGSWSRSRLVALLEYEVERWSMKGRYVFVVAAEATIMKLRQGPQAELVTVARARAGTFPRRLPT